METSCLKLKEQIVLNFNTICGSFTSVDWLLFQNFIYAIILLLQEIVDGTITYNSSEMKLLDNGNDFLIDELKNNLMIKYGFYKNEAIRDISNKIILGEPEIYKLFFDTIEELALSQDNEEFEELQAELETLLNECKDKELQFYEAAIETGQLSNDWMEKANSLVALYCQSAANSSVSDDAVNSENAVNDAHKVIYVPEKKNRFAKTRRVRFTKNDTKPLRKTKYGPNTRRQLTR